MIIKNKGKKLYWNTIKKDDMKSLLKIAKKDYKDAVKRMDIDEYGKDYILNETKRGKISKIVEKYNKKKDPKLLDIGAGYGAVSISLARKFNTTSVDVNKETLQFVKYRAKQEKVKLRTKRINNLVHGLPFNNKSFDIIVMNGVLEWTPCRLEDNPRKIQLKILKDINKKLKNKGLFFLAIENRYAKEWFKGKKSHTQIKYIDLLPRKIADIICKMKKGHKFRTYIYSKKGYKKLLGEAGFKVKRVYTAYPTYQKPEKIYPNKSFFVNSFIIVCEKE